MRGVRRIVGPHGSGSRRVLQKLQCADGGFAGAPATEPGTAVQGAWSERERGPIAGGAGG